MWKNRPTGGVKGASLLVVVALFAVAPGCATATSEPSGTSATPVASSESAFPVTIEHRFGATTIDGRPRRVVTVGLTDHDAALAVGVAPLGVTEWFGEHPSATWPWATDELGSSHPEVIGTAAEMNFERIAALSPDLILAVYAGLTDSDYDTLTQIAPTVAQPAEYVDYGVPWDEQTLIIGRALGESARAEAAVAEVHDLLGDATEAHPEFERAAGLVASPYGGVVSVYAPQDARGRFLASLGFEQPPEIEQLAGDSFSADLSYERVDLLDVDALVWIIGDIDTDRASIESEPLYTSLAVHRDGHATYVENLSPVGGALSFQSVLSLPLLIEELVPQLARAVEGNGNS